MKTEIIKPYQKNVKLTALQIFTSILVIKHTYWKFIFLLEYNTSVMDPLTMFSNSYFNSPASLK